MDPKERNYIFNLGEPDIDVLKTVVDENDWEYISSAISLQSKNKDWQLLFLGNRSFPDIFKKYEDINPKNIAILCFYKEDKKFALLKEFITRFVKQKIKFELFPFFIIFKHHNDEYIENNYEKLLNELVDKSNIEICRNKLIFALKNTSLETYLSKIKYVLQGYSNLFIDKKDIKKLEELTNHKLIFSLLKRKPIIFKDRKKIIEEIDELITNIEFNNIMLFFDLSIEDSSQIIIDVIKKFKDKYKRSDVHPFFIFYTSDIKTNKKEI